MVRLHWRNGGLAVLADVTVSFPPHEFTHSLKFLIGPQTQVPLVVGLYLFTVAIDGTVITGTPVVAVEHGQVPLAPVARGH
jgi:hypothetical protein